MKKVLFIMTLVFLCMTTALTAEKEEFDKILQNAESGDPLFQYKAALSYMFDKRYTEDKKEKEPDYESAFFWLSISAEKGHLESQYLLSRLYELGKGTKKDYKKAIYWYKKAVENEKENAIYLIKIVKGFVKEKDLPAKFKPLKKYLHEPFKIGSCLVCHTDNDSNSAELITKEISKLCYKCHPRQDSKEFDHEPVKNGRCTDCHDPHQSDTKLLIKGSDTNDLCLKCHEKKRKPKSVRLFIEFDKKNRHKPAEESCLNCHEIHTAEHKSLLKTDDGKMGLCFECHKEQQRDKKLKDTINNAKYKHGPIQNSENRCLECHDVHAAEYEKLLQKDIVPLCLSCHDESIKTEEDGRMLLNISQHLKEHPSWHKPIKEAQKSGGCIACHEPHGSENINILKKPYAKEYYENVDKEDFICFECHRYDKIKKEINTNTGFRDGDVNLHFVHVNYKKGRSCKMCHDVHASKYKHLIRDYTVIGNARFLIRHTATQNGGSCAPACHRKSDYDRIKPKGIGILKNGLKK